MNWNTGLIRVTNRSVARVKFFHPFAATPPHTAAAVILIAAAVLLGASCATVPSPGTPPPIQAEPREAPEPVTTPLQPGTPTPTHAGPAEPLPAPVAPTPSQRAAREQLTIHIESNPAGAMIVVDGKPIGRAPLDIAFDAASNGFFKEPVIIRARFVANDAAGESFSVDARLGPLERIPLALVFSHDGVQRVIRQY